MFGNLLSFGCVKFRHERSVSFQDVFVIPFDCVEEGMNSLFRSSLIRAAHHNKQKENQSGWQAEVTGAFGKSDHGVFLKKTCKGCSLRRFEVSDISEKNQLYFTITPLIWAVPGAYRLKVKQFNTMSMKEAS